MYGLGNLELGLEVTYEAVMALLNLALFFGIWAHKERDTEMNSMQILRDEILLSQKKKGFFKVNEFNRYREVE